MASTLSCVVGEHVLYLQPPTRCLQSGGVLFSDPFDQEEEFDDTGLFGVWPAAYTLCRYLARHPELVRGERVLELGCGAGLPSLLCDRLGAASVVATDGTDEVIDQMHASFRANACAGQVSAMRLDWGDTQQLLRIIADADVTLVIGTDLVYPLRDQQPLISSLSIARRRFPHLKVMLSEGCRDSRTHERFEEALQCLGTDGVVETEVADDKLFGSLRVDLYLLHACQQGDGQKPDDVEGEGEEIESACVLGETHDAGLRSKPKADTRHTSLPQLRYPALRLPPSVRRPKEDTSGFSLEVDSEVVRTRAVMLEDLLSSKIRNQTSPDGWLCHGANERVQLDSFRLVYPARTNDLEVVIMKPQRPAEHDSNPLSTSGYLYIPTTYTLLAHLFLNASLFEGKRVIELGAGLGLCAAFLQQWKRPPSQLIVTDGDARVLPLLAENLESNRLPGHAASESRLLMWGAAALKDSGVASCWDLVVASDPIFYAEAPSKEGVRPVPTQHISALMETAAGLLNPLNSESCFVLSFEPRDALRCDLLLSSTLQAATDVGLCCVAKHTPRLTGVQRPEWQTDLLVFTRGSSASTAETRQKLI